MIPVSRRIFVGGAIAAAGAAALPFGRGGRATSALPASRFFESVGICTHPSWRRSVWGSSDWASRFNETGVPNTRGEVGHGDSGAGALADLRSMFATGVKLCAIVTGRSLDRDIARADVAFLADHVGAENLCGIESVNEYNNPRHSPADWAPRLRSFQAWLHDMVRSNRALDAVPLIAPSIWNGLPRDYRALGNLEPNVDRGCFHYYTGGRRPTRMGVPSDAAELGQIVGSTVERAIADARTLAPGRGLWATEFGYRIAGAGADTRSDLSESIATKYLLRGLFDMFARGVEKTFIYTLIDDSHRRTPVYHGLLDSSLRPRLAFYALRNLMALFRDEGRSRPAPPPDYALSGGTRGVKQLAFSRSDGSRLLVFYQDADSYDRWTRRELEVAPVTLQLSFAQPARVEVFDPVAGALPVRTEPRTTSLDIAVGDTILIVKVSGAAPLA